MRGHFAGGITLADRARLQAGALQIRPSKIEQGVVPQAVRVALAELGDLDDA
jgi:hypothetical protein